MNDTVRIPQLAPSRRLSRPECRSWLASHREGRLGYRSGCGERAVVLTYALTEDEVVFRLPEYNPVLQYAPGEQVTLAVEESHGDVAESVTVTGTARTVPDDTPLELAEAWPDGVSTRLMCLPLTSLEGDVHQLVG